MAENTHAVTKPNTRPPAPIEVFRKNMEGKFLEDVQAHFNGNKNAALSFKTSCLAYIRKVPALLECDLVSVMSAFVQVAQYNFLPSNAGGEAYVIPYAKEAKMQFGYQGYVTLLARNKVFITSNIIYKNDVFEYEEGMDMRLKHIPAMFGKERGPAIGVYTIAQMANGAKTFKVMDEAGIMRIKNLSKAKDKKDSPWNSHLDPELWMWKKTCLIQHCKLLPKTPELQRAIEIDYEGEGIDKPTLNADGPAAKKVDHKAPVKVESKDITPDDQTSPEDDVSDIFPDEN